MLIRVFAMSIFRITFLRELFKQAVVKLLITGKKKIKGISVERKFKFEDNKIFIEDHFKGKFNSYKIERPGYFKSIHMASSGYNTLNNL